MKTTVLSAWLIGARQPTAGAGGYRSTGGMGLSSRREVLVSKRADTVERGRGGPVDREGMRRAAEQAAAAVGVEAEGHSDASGGASGSVLAGAMPPPPSRRPSVRVISKQLGMDGPLGGVECRDRWSTEPPVAERIALNTLRDAADRRVDMAAAGGEAGPSHLATALGWLRRFVAAFPSRELFVAHAGAGDVHAAAYNEETFRLFGEFVRKHGSVRPGTLGKVVSASTIADYISALRAHRSLQAGYNLLVSGGNLRLPRQMQQMRREDGPAGQRALSRGMTARLLRRLLPLATFDRQTRRGRLRWAVLWVAHNLLLRGGELGKVDNRVFDSATGIAIADVDWIAPCADTGGYEVVVVDVMPIKDARVLRARVPMVIRRRVHGSFSGTSELSSPCAWEALRMWWLCRSAECARTAWGTEPLFALMDGSPVCTATVLGFVREAAAAMGEDPAQFDSHSLRIGGATDLHHLFGGADAERFIQKRGRWCSMVHQIYSRMSASTSMLVSAQMLDADGVDMEAFRQGYVMPAARFRPRA